jgi:hypothetical protein
MGKHKFYKSFWNIKHIRDGKEIWSIRKQNSLVDEGEEAILEAFFRLNASYTPTEFYVRLCDDTIEETDTLSIVQNEPSGFNYTPQLVEASAVGFPVKDMFEGDYRLTSKELTFTASGGDIGPVNTVFLATTDDNTGKLIAFLDLPLTRTILNGDSMIVQFEVILE